VSAVNRARFQWEHISELIIREALATGRTTSEIIELIRADIDSQAGESS